MRLQDKVALVTGGGCGFGEGIAKLYAAEGAKVLLADIDGARAERVAGEIGSAARASTADVAKGPDFERMVQDALGAFGRLDIVVNNAGITHRNRPMLEVERTGAGNDNNGTTVVSPGCSCGHCLGRRADVRRIEQASPG